MRALLALLLVATACRKDPGPDGDAPAYDGVLDQGLVNPWPNHLLMDAGKLAIPADVMAPVSTPDPSRLTWRDGFSVAQTSVLQLPDIDPSDFPGPTSLRPGEGSVRMLDLTTGAWLPLMAELDAHPDAEQPALLVRPLVALTPGHRIGVAVTTAAVDRPDAFDALLTGEAGRSNEALSSHMVELVEAFDGAGLAEADVAVAWDFPVSDARAPLRSALDQLELSGTWSWQFTRDADDGDSLVPTAWRTGTGTFEVTDFLVDDRILDLQPDGTVRPTGTASANLYVHIPQSVRDAPAGSVPVMVFGHGIFASPQLYLDEEDDPSGLQQLAEEAGIIVVGTNWRGLTTTDTVEVIAAAVDFKDFPPVPERLVQAQVNARTLTELVVGGQLFDDPLFVGDSGQKLPMEGRAVYYGISLGGIQGAILLANDAPLDAAAFHVGGSMWSTMLERSSNWSTFEAILVDAVPAPEDRQLLYSMSQLWWDFADPISFTEELVDRPMLYQVSMGDEQVPNLTSEALARSIDLPLLQPSATTPDGLDPVTGPLPPGSRAFVQFDPELPPNPPDNRPKPVTGAHHGPRLWTGARRQVIDHLQLGSEGQIVHHCGDAVCSESNQGD